MGYLTREQILSADDIQREEVPVPEWGGVVLVQGMTGDQLADYHAAIVTVEGEGKKQTVTVNERGANHVLASICIVDENGGAVFSVEDAEALGKKSGAALTRVVEAARRLSGMDKAADEEAEKNSEPTLTSEHSFA